ncbi:two-component system sensor histidine kinase NtrB [Chthonobacter rhizosphaerae]|uniref:two-component system sensor histidine kinase NtrB n=1 Tax=Chthonobacter rhizosphaerae TaxID=2735553 RepID=UPI0015EF0148|nr:PAS domain S-box protein [Chthonobacter rhizosphaerae]
MTDSGAFQTETDARPDRSPVSEARFASVLDTAADGIVVIDERGVILAFNKSCERLFGYTAEEAIGQNVKIIMPPSYAVEHDRYISHYRRTGERRIIGIGREVAGMHRDGTIFPVELSVGEAPTTEGRQFIGILRDLRSRKQTEQRLSQLQAQIMHMTRLSAMDEMGAAMAHELNQPLTALMLYLQAIIRQTRADSGKPLKPDQIRAIMEKALMEAERAGGIIQRMRQMVEKRDPERSRINLVDVVDEAVDLTAFVAQGSTVTIRRLFPHEPVAVDADPIQIQQIVLNLLRNAVEVARDSRDKWVEVRVGRTETEAFVSVEDSGPGIAPDAAATLFRTFSTTKKSGMGLGLAISRSIAQNHGGDLGVAAGGEGKGAVFTLTLPMGERNDGTTEQGDG